MADNHTETRTVFRIYQTCRNIPFFDRGEAGKCTQGKYRTVRVTCTSKIEHQRDFVKSWFRFLLDVLDVVITMPPRVKWGNRQVRAFPIQLGEPNSNSIRSDGVSVKK